MTGVSFIRSYFLRRIFNSFRTRWFNHELQRHDS
jgi:hypothetical protein